MKYIDSFSCNHAVTMLDEALLLSRVKHHHHCEKVKRYLSLNRKRRSPRDSSMGRPVVLRRAWNDGHPFVEGSVRVSIQLCLISTE